MLFLDIIIAEPLIINNAGYEFDIKDLIIHIIIETIATVAIEGLIFSILCKEVKFRKIAFINAITCIGLHIIYYILAKFILTDIAFPTNPTFKTLVIELLTKHIMLITFLEIIMFLIEYLFYIHSTKNEKGTLDRSLQRKIFLVTLLSNFIAFFIGILISSGIVMILIK